MLTAPDSINKHLTEEVRTLLADPKNKQAAMYVMALKGMAGQKGIQTFEAGDTLLSYQEPRSNDKLEVHVDSDDLNGEEDNLQLSAHAFRDGKEIRQEWSSIASGFTVNMKKEQNIWRLNKISTTLEFPIGSAEFLKELMTGKEGQGQVTGIGLRASAGGPESTSSATSPDISGEQAVMMLGFAEQAFARQHPETGFTCSWSDLQDASASFGLNKQVSSGSYNGYRFTLSGCEGHPAGSFRLTAEPMTGQGKAFCVDATENVRFSEDGRGATCLLSGKINEQGAAWLT
ncbi:MAG TPA: hypothetical protein VE783_03455, partial [Candidatus Limnocylindrales bacterium]|nr:hypothetical protein [Candidatus Limnocylindrales bacterium]